MNERGGSDRSAPGGAAPVWERAPWRTGADVAVLDVSGGRPWSYDELDERARLLAESLRAQGLLPGQLVALPERPGDGLVLMQHALARTGAALLPVRSDPADQGIPGLLAATGAEWVWWPEVGRLKRVGAGPAVRSHPGVEGAGGPWSSPLALVVETSGSTGGPRAAMLTADALLTSAGLVNRHLGLAAGDTWLCCLSLRHIGGLAITYRCALAGAKLLLHGGFEPAAVAADLEARGVTHLSLVPPMLARLLALGRPPPPSLRVLLVGGQALSGVLARQAIDAGWPLHVTYGMTETGSQIATSDRLTEPPSHGRVGRTLPGLELACGGCTEGASALRVRGPLVMTGYANPRRVPGSGLADGWFTTSDLACWDPDGALCILGRADEVLVTGGVNVHPGRVEAALAGVAGVAVVAVVGVDDAVWGKRLVALYQGDAAPADLDAWCRANLPGPERPRTFHPLPDLPALASGKLDRRGLQDLAAAMPRGDPWRTATD